jgi:vacuolar-type H+-ATPase subunit E/Vma4
MRREPEYFGERDLTLIYVAKKLKEALALESVLSEAGVDYLAEPDRYTGGVIFRTERVGVFFYVLPEAEEAARRVLEEHGYRLHASLGRPAG